MIALAFLDWQDWFNYPGLELWKFLNLAIFLAVGIYILRRPISEALGARREAIKQELVQAQEQKARAEAKIAEADSLLSRLDADVRTVREQAVQEAESERQRLAAATQREIEKLKQQAEREIETATRLRANRCASFSRREASTTRAKPFVQKCDPKTIAT